MRYGIFVARDLLPDLIRDWFHEQIRHLEKPTEAAPPPTPLRLHRGTRALTIRLARSRAPGTYHLLLAERETASAAGRHPFTTLGLSPREVEILHWLAQGKSNTEIGIILGLSTGTISRHLENIYPTLGLTGRHAAGLMALHVLSAHERTAVAA